MQIDHENPRILDTYRELIDLERRTLETTGASPRDVLMWLAGARWAIRIAQGMEAEERTGRSGPPGLHRMIQDHPEGAKSPTDGSFYVPAVWEAHDPGCPCFDCLEAEDAESCDRRERGLIEGGVE